MSVNFGERFFLHPIGIEESYERPVDTIRRL
jgi:hypothetical protein